MRPSGIIWLAMLLGLNLGMVAWPAPYADTAHAETSQGRGVELLSRAAKSYEAGAYADAAQLLDSAFKAGLTGEMAARAILLRAEINEREGALARALQDYSNALWMESLPAADRNKATEGKQRVMAAMGLSGTAADAPRAANASGSAAPTSGSSSSTGGVFDFFGGIFTGVEQKPETPAPVQPQPSAQAAAAPEPAATPPQKKSAQAPIKAKTVHAAKSAPAAAQGQAQPASTMAVASTAGNYLIIFGAASSEASGLSTAKSIKAQLSDILINRELDVTQKAGGGFQVQAGPYKTKSSALALCSAIKQRGIPCQVTP